MTEGEAREAVRSLVEPRGYDRLERLAKLVAAENERQNLIARSTIATIWNRHILDSIQLLRWRSDRAGLWLDIGTGGGFPGLAIAAATDGELLLVEPRRLRAEFLQTAAVALNLRHTGVATTKVEAITTKASIISARAVAPLQKVLQASIHCATPTARWLMLRGRLAAGELTLLEERSRLMFHVEQSLSDPASSIVIVDRTDTV